MFKKQLQHPCFVIRRGGGGSITLARRDLNSTFVFPMITSVSWVNNLISFK